MTRANARELAVHLIYGRDFTGEEPDQVVATRLNKEYYAKLSEENQVYSERPSRAQMVYIDTVVAGVANRSKELNQQIQKYSIGWDISRISRPCRSGKGRDIGPPAHFSVNEFSFAAEDAEGAGGAEEKREISIATGVAAFSEISSIARRMEEIYPNLKINVYKIINKFFGESITVAGLLTGKDICEQLEDQPLGEVLLISKSALRQGEDVFLCGMTVEEMEKKLSVRVRAVENDGDSLLHAILGDCEA